MSDNSAVVMDNGSGFSKIGIATKENPKLISFPTLVGQHRSDFFLHGSDSKFYIGHDAINKKGELTFFNPVQNGLIEDWDYMYRVWQYSFNYELKVDPQEHPVLLTEHPTNTKDKRQKTIEIFFEKFKVPVFFLANQSVLALYALGKTTGLVLDVGEDCSTATAVYKGYSIKSSTVQSKIGGKMLTEYIKQSFGKEKILLKYKAFREVIQEIKEKHCYLPDPYQDFSKNQVNSSRFPSKKEVNPSQLSSENKEDSFHETFKIKVQRNEENSLVLPDGQQLNLHKLSESVPSLLFNYQSSMFPSENRAQDLVFECLSKLDDDMIRRLSTQIAVTGGSSRFLNFKKTLKLKLSDRLKKHPFHFDFKIDLITPSNEHEKINLANIKTMASQKVSYGSDETSKLKLSEAKIDHIPANFLTWVGGSCLASRKLFQTEWIRQADWMEEGPSIIHRYCL